MSAKITPTDKGDALLCLWRTTPYDVLCHRQNNKHGAQRHSTIFSIFVFMLAVILFCPYCHCWTAGWALLIMPDQNEKSDYNEAQFRLQTTNFNQQTPPSTCHLQPMDQILWHHDEWLTVAIEGKIEWFGEFFGKKLQNDRGVPWQRHYLQHDMGLAADQGSMQNLGIPPNKCDKHV